MFVKSKKESVRVQLYPEDKSVLEEIARENGCLYAGEGNLSLLLQKISQGKLTIKEVGRVVDSIERKQNSKEKLLGLEVRVASDLNGNIAKIAEKIGESGGNIYDVKARDHDPVIRISFCMEKDNHINDLIDKFKEIKIREVLQFNRPEKYEKLLETLNPDAKFFYDILKRKSHKIDSNTILRCLLEEYEDKSLITDISIIVAIRVRIKNMPGNLAKLSHQLAKDYISILEIDQKVNPGEDINIANLILGFYPFSTNQPIKEIESTKSFTNNLSRLDYIESAAQESFIFSK